MSSVRTRGEDGARRIAELEYEVRELKRANETLKQYVSRALDLDTSPRRPEERVSVPAPRATQDRPRGFAPEPADPARRSDGHAPGTGVEFRVLGPVEAAVGGRWVDLGAPKQRAALVLLVSQVGRPVSVDVLVEALWDGRPPQSAITSLHAYIANLRRALEPHRAPRTPSTVLCTRGRGYLLNSRAVEVDAHRFWTHATAGWQALDRGDPRRALYAFEAGLALWRGAAYAEVAAAPPVTPEAVRLEELRLSVTEGRCATLIAVGNHEMAVPELVAFTQAHPLREYGCELLSLALYRAGRQADALSVLRAHQKRMVEELGISASPALQHLELEILRQAPELEHS
ncbi:MULTISPECIES: AfsR/SARP family transcriptional regulator [Streptomyces]|uniref:AfsR/SARP family transcriptional regulator n=1 Tax=Streptomyces TaxID=1883 RepID=UPI001587DBEF|nr:MULTISPECIES: AfsR/SARP family transcriptional regulator [unclassified Streptomyces]NUV66412.1 AfsR/SARP family transcriptional regulator [Streptomyces sp. CAI-121]NUV98629.1 AfsR/SARP family transcriptional regulator [Streptomyces sp. CAI 127]NUW11906.1 AfsR/SARP family transcriptional regulator [Streptomyces sp. CAI-68]